MKKLFALLLAVLMLGALAGCGAEPQPEDAEATTTTVEAAQATTQPTEITTKEPQPTDGITEEQPPSTRMPLATRYLEEVEAAYKADALLPEYESTAGMCELNDKYANYWADIADEYYYKLLAYEHDEDYSTPFCTVEEFRTALIDMKTDHKEYVEKEMTAYNTILKYEYQGGSISGVISSGHRCSLEKEWALKILDICDMLGVE